MDAHSDLHGMLEESLERSLANVRDRASLWSLLAQNGMLGMALGEEHGGAGLGFAEIALVARILGRCGLGLPYRAFEAQSAPLLAAVAAMPAVERILPGLSDGSVRVALAADGRFCISTREVGESFRIEGQARFVEGMDRATHVIVSATLAGQPALFLFPTTTEGLSYRPYAVTHGDPLSDLDLKGVAVSAGACISRGGEARSLLDRAFCRGVIATCASMVGAMETLMDLTAEHLRTRRQFGRALAEFQVLQHAAADMYVELELAQGLVAYGCTCLTGDQTPPAATMDMIKIGVNDAARAVGASAVQLHGGIGMTMESAVGRLFATLTEARNSFGTSRECMARLIKADTGTPQF